MSITEGMRVQGIDLDGEGETPEGVITRIEVETEGTGSGEPETTYWITWDGTNAPDAHGREAFVPLPDLPKGYAVVESTPTDPDGVVRLLRRDGSWAVQYRKPWGESGLNWCASEANAREFYESAIEN